MGEPAPTQSTPRAKIRREPEPVRQPPCASPGGHFHLKWSEGSLSTNQSVDHLPLHPSGGTAPASNEGSQLFNTGDLWAGSPEGEGISGELG